MLTEGEPTIETLRPCAAEHLAAYTDSAGPFAFATYDRWYASPDRLTPLDCLAANLLSLRLGQADVIPLFQPGFSPATVLREAMQRLLDRTAADHTPRFLRLDSIDDGVFQLLREANTRAEQVPQWTAVTVCKVLHRLRPHLVPLYDSVVQAFYGTRNRPARFFAALHKDLRRNETWLAELGSGFRTSDGRELSVLRSADIVIWHHHRIGCWNQAIAG